MEKVSFKNQFKKNLIAVCKSFKNETFLYILKRIISSLFTIILIIALVTALIRAIPDAYILQEINSNPKIISNPDVYRAAKAVQLFRFGRARLDGTRISIIESVIRYLLWILPYPKRIPIVWDSEYKNVIQYVDSWVYLGRSLIQNEYVKDMLKSRIGISFIISIITVFFSYLISCPLGIAMAKKPGGIVDKIGNLFIILNYAIPGLVFYLLMNKILGNPEGIFGKLNFGYSYSEENFVSLIPPITCMVFLSIPGLSVWIRRFMVEEINSDYVKFARSKGLSENKIMYKHVFKNAFVPLVRNLPVVFIGAIVGSYYVEIIWNIPGTGNLLINAMKPTRPDVQVIQGLTVIYSFMSMMSFLLGDIITSIYDPRIKLRAEVE